MTNLNLIVLSYHEFTDEPNDYQFSRTYDQFDDDMRNKTFDLITIDDAHCSQYMAMKMMALRNIRGILFVPTALVGSSKKYLTWENIYELSKYHEIGNHSHKHVVLPNLTIPEIYEQVTTANNLILKNIGKIPRFFVPPYNKSNKHVDNIAEKLNLQIVRNRVDILNTTP